MHRLLIQCLAMLTMLTAIVHAQCLLVCSFQTHSSPAAAIKTVDSGEHSCCPQQSSKKQAGSEKSNSGKPCSPAELAVTASASEIGAAPIAASPAMLQRLDYALLPPVDLQHRFSRPQPIDGPAPAILSSISILRI